MRPADALVKLAAILDYSGNAAFVKYTAGMLQAVGLTGGRPIGVLGDTPAVQVPVFNKGDDALMRDQAKGWIEVEQLALRSAEVYHVAAHMTDVVYGASATLDDTDHVRHETLPAESGIAFFDDPLKLLEARGQQQRIHALSWHVGACDYKTSEHSTSRIAGVWLTFWGASSDPEDEVMTKLREQSDPALVAQLGPYHPIYVGHLAWGHRAGPAVVTHHSKVEETGVQGATFAVPGENDDDYGSDLPPIQDTYYNHNRPVMALWRLFNQTIVSNTQQQADRATAKAMRRRKLPQQVTVIKLRKQTVHSDGQTEVEWGYRWWVRGHWAWRACSEDHPSAEPGPNGWRTRVYIAPYAKNAERQDLPWHVTEKVNSLQR
jgi:hypothetical protein